MSTDSPQRRVLVIGASQRVLDQAVAGLRALGFIAQATNDFHSDIARLFAAERIDLVMLGTRLPADRQAELRTQIGAVNPRVIFLQSLGGIPDLIINQVRATFAPNHGDLAHAPSYAPDDRSIRLTLADQARVKVTVYWRTAIIPPDPESDSLVLLDDQLGPGDHAIPVPDQVFLPPRRSPDSPDLPPARFATVQVDAAIYNFSIVGGTRQHPSHGELSVTSSGFTPSARLNG